MSFSCAASPPSLPPSLPPDRLFFFLGGREGGGEEEGFKSETYCYKVEEE